MKSYTKRGRRGGEGGGGGVKGHGARKRKRTVGAVAIQGLAPNHEHVSDIGIYTHTGREVNGRGVYCIVGHHEAFLFYSDRGSWCISDAADMTAGAHQGSLMVESDAETPHAITESWSVHDSETWSAGAPDVRVRLASIAEVKEAERSAAQFMNEAQTAAQRMRTINVHGVPEGEEYDDSMGSYVLVEDGRCTVNGRCVWQLLEETVGKETESAAGEAADADEDTDEDEAIFLYFAAVTGSWYISFRANMEVGASNGWLRSKSIEHGAAVAVYTPDAPAGNWQVYDIESDSWSETTVRCCSAQAM